MTIATSQNKKLSLLSNARYEFPVGRYKYNLIRFGVGVKYPRGTCMGTVIDLEEDNAHNAELPLPFYSEFAFEWGTGAREFRKRETLLAKSIIYHYLIFMEGYELDDLPSHPRVPFVIGKFRDEIISLAPFGGCVS